MDDHIARILKMLEEGKITAAEAQSLIAALGARGGAGGPSAAGARAEPKSGEARAQERAESTRSSEAGRAKSFEFQWSQRRGFPLDLSGLGRQISEAVKRIDPERIVKEARTGFSRGSRRMQEAFRGLSWFAVGDEGRPENVLGQPTARSVETLEFDLGPEPRIQVENHWGAIAVQGGGDRVVVEVEREAWAATEEEAGVRLRELHVETHVPEVETGPGRLEMRVEAPDEWRDGTVNLRLTVPEAAALKLATVFGEVRVENTRGTVEIHALSGRIALENLGGDVSAEGITGEVHAAGLGGPVTLASKSGDIHAESLHRGGVVSGISGEVRISRVEGGRLEARSVSGDVVVEEVGRTAPLDVTIESVSGDVRLVRARGNISLKTVSGDVEADHLDALTLQSQTVSGDVGVELDSAFSGALTANTVSGDVEIRAPRGSCFRFTIATQSGSLHCAHPVEDSRKTDTLWTGTVGTGAGTVSVTTRSGDVRLELPSDA